MIAARVTGTAGARNRLRKLADQGRAAAMRAVADLGVALKAHRHRSAPAKSATAPAGARTLVRPNNASDSAGSDRVFNITANMRKALEQTKERFEPPKPRGSLARGRPWHSKALPEPASLHSPTDNSWPGKEAVVIGKLREAMRR